MNEPLILRDSFSLFAKTTRAGNLYIGFAPTDWRKQRYGHGIWSRQPIAAIRGGKFDWINDTQAIIPKPIRDLLEPIFAYENLRNVDAVLCLTVGEPMKRMLYREFFQNAGGKISECLGMVDPYRMEINKAGDITNIDDLIKWRQFNINRAAAKPDTQGDNIYNVDKGTTNTNLKMLLI